MMMADIHEKIFGDRGYTAKELFDDLWDKGTHLVTRIKKNIKNILMPIADKLMLPKRTLIDTIIGRIKLLDKLEHSSIDHTYRLL